MWAAHLIATLPVPETIMSCSSAVCQCQGTIQPVGNFAKITEGPFDGSPLCTEAVMHVGRPGRFTNLLLALLAYTILSSAAAQLRANPISKSAKRKTPS